MVLIRDFSPKQKQPKSGFFVAASGGDNENSFCAAYLS